MEELTEKLDAAKQRDPTARAFSYYYSRNEVMSQVFYYNLRAYVNFETGEVSFNSPDFIQLIEFAKTFPETYSWDDQNTKYIDERYDMMKGVQLVQLTGISRFEDYMGNEAVFDGKLAFKGFPCETRDGNVFQSQLGLSMSKQSDNKDGAWKFIRTVLTEEYAANQSWSFPANNKIFEERLKAAMTPETAESFYKTNGYYYGEQNRIGGGVLDSGSTVVLYDEAGASPAPTGAGVRIPKGTVWMYNEAAEAGTSEGIDLPYYEMTEAQRDKFMTFLNSVTHLDAQDTKLVEIVNEELAPFFADQKSADATVAVIQSRTKIYVNEQR